MVVDTAPARPTEGSLREAMVLLNRWRIAISAAGFLWVRPIGPELRLVELARFVQRLRPACGGGFPSEMLVDLSAVRIVGAPKSLVRNLFVHFGKSIGTHCSVVC